MAPHQIVYTHGGGRLGNQILRLVHWLAWVQAHPECAVTDVAFWPYARHFAAWREHPGCTVPVRGGRPDRWARLLARLPAAVAEPLHANNRFLRLVQSAGERWPGAQGIRLDITREEAIELDDPDVLARIRSRSVTFVSGWKISAWARVAAAEAGLREFFRPEPDTDRRAAAYIAALRREYDVVAGVFIRHTDYQTWHQGRFHFAASTYAAWMRQLLDLHPGRRVAFVVASDVAHDQAVFAGLPVHFASGSPNVGGPAIASWAELGRCDFVLTPPSTFSVTAAFAGGCPVWPVGTADQKLDASQGVTGLAAAARHPLLSLAVK